MLLLLLLLQCFATPASDRPLPNGDSHVQYKLPLPASNLSRSRGTNNETALSVAVAVAVAVVVVVAMDERLDQASRRQAAKTVCVVPYVVESASDSVYCTSIVGISRTEVRQAKDYVE
jgi:hypothetical protein